MKWKVLSTALLFLIAVAESRWVLDRICDYELTDSFGIITSPNYPHSYPGSVSCTYKINPPAGKIVTLSISDIDLGWNQTDNCSGRLDIYDGDDEVSFRTDTFCGTDYYIPGKIYNSTTNALFLKFESLGSTEGNRGFHALYRTVDVQCGGFSRTPGILKHPINGTTYQNNQNCTWVIQAPPTHIVNLTFSIFNTEASFDYVQIREVYNGQIVDIIKLSGANLRPLPVVTRGRTMYVNFKSDASNVQTGFTGNYRFIDISNV